MTKGVLVIARNNSKIDYVKQANWLAKRISKYLNLPTSIITDNAAYVNKHYPNTFDQIIEIPNEENYTHKSYKDGMYSRANLEFKNTARCDVYELTPYNETLLMDTDVAISNNTLANCFDENNEVMLYKDAVELSNWRDLSEFEYISPNSIDFYWATVVFFRKSHVAKTLFDCVKHVQQNWQHYRNLYQITNPVFRNDFAFSIAVHIMNGNKKGNFIKQLPGTLYYITDRDLLIEETDGVFKFLVEKKDSTGYFPVKITGENVHIINKFSLGRYIDEQS